MNTKFEKSIFFDKFISELNKCAEDWKKESTDPQLLAPIVTLCQSTGHGKTKFMKEFSENYLSIFMCLRDKSEFGCPYGSNIADCFLESTNEEKSCILFFVKFFIVI